MTFQAVIELRRSDLATLTRDCEAVVALLGERRTKRTSGRKLRLVKSQGNPERGRSSSGN